MNPVKPKSWTEELAHDHAQLGHLLSRVRQLVVTENREARDRSLGTLLTALTIEVREHMEFEEHDGYLAPVQQRVPEKAATIEQLRGEHDVLQSQLARILADATVRPGVYAFSEEISPQVLQWIDRMRNHERRENQLVQDAFNRDISAGD